MLQTLDVANCHAPCAAEGISAYPLPEKLGELGIREANRRFPAARFKMYHSVTPSRLHAHLRDEGGTCWNDWMKSFNEALRVDAAKLDSMSDLEDLGSCRHHR